MDYTIVYLIRHSEVLAGINNLANNDQEINEKRVLSVKGEELAKKVSKCLTNIDVLYSSNYIRCIETSKYIAYNNGIEINCDNRLGERKIGQKGKMEWRDFERLQHKDFDFHLPGGESINQVAKRMSVVLKDILSSNDKKNIAIVSHGTAIVSLLSNWCEKGYNFDGKLLLNYKDDVMYDGDIRPMQIYRLTFDKLKLVNIEIIKQG